MFHLLDGKQCISYILINKFSYINSLRFCCSFMTVIFILSSHEFLIFLIENPFKLFLMCFGGTTKYLVLKAFNTNLLAQSQSYSAFVCIVIQRLYIAVGHK